MGLLLYVTYMEMTTVHIHAGEPTGRRSGIIFFNNNVLGFCKLALTGVEHALSHYHNGLSHERRQAIVWTNVDIYLLQDTITALIALYEFAKMDTNRALYNVWFQVEATSMENRNFTIHLERENWVNMQTVEVKMSHLLTLLMLETTYSGFVGQYHACWCS